MPEQVLAHRRRHRRPVSGLGHHGAWCSLRFGELAGLRRSGSTSLHRKIHVTEQLVELAGGKTMFKAPKSDAGSVGRVPAELVPILEDHLADYVGPERRRPAVHQPGGPSAAANEVPAPLGRACKAAGMTGLHFHDLRGSGATWAAVTGATLPELMHRLGHRTHTAALRYQHATAERHREVADRLGALLNVTAEEGPPPPT